MVWDWIAGSFAKATGSAWALTAALVLVFGGWALGEWDVVDAVATAATFLMVFGLQRTANTNQHAIQAKLDELIAATDAARNDLLHIEDAPDKVIDEVRT